jgi:DNA polymerase I-like protein with 3'-5' exonuclease and polymerase domains
MIIFDIETNGLNPDKIHCMVFVDTKSKVSKCTFTGDYEYMKEILLSGEPLLGHNIIRYDIPVLEKILNIKIKSRLYDTLPMSWVMNPTRSKHGLDSFYQDFGIPKLKIDDWENLSFQDYVDRCTNDVMITDALWNNLLPRFLKVYGCKKMLDKFFRYLEFKMDCAKEAERQGWKLDVDLAHTLLDEWTRLQEEKIKELVKVMPMRKLYKTQTRPKVYQKKDGSLSSHGKKWKDLLEEHGLPSDYIGEVTVVKGTEDPNPNSTDQVKDWLFSLGWKPCTYKYNKNKETGEEKKVEQIRKNGELTESVKLLIDKNPAVGVLDGLTVLQHRLGIVKGFVDCEENGYVKAEIDGLTNTLRFKHKKPLVNLPSVEKQYGKEIRSCLIATPGHLLCGADMTSLEDTTKRHYMMPYDPQYVKEMSVEGFDPHLDLARHAKFVTQKQIDQHNRGEIDLKPIRKNFKVVNYSATYGVGAEKLARETGMPIYKAKKLLEAYWDRNWSVKKFAEDQPIRKIGEEMWIQNPVSKFWHSLRYEKDAFSTINQSTGSYCFDRWVAIYRNVRSNIIGQFHDESINLIKEGEEKEHTEVLKSAVQRLNEQLKLNVSLGIDVQYGNNYAEVH